MAFLSLEGVEGAEHQPDLCPAASAASVFSNINYGTASIYTSYKD